MKLFGIVLLAGYLFARERESGFRNQEAVKEMGMDWLVYVLCAGLAALTGIFLEVITGTFQPAAVFLAAALPAVFFRGRAGGMIAGAMTAFCALRGMPDLNRFFAILLGMEAGVLMVAFLYLGLRARMDRLAFPLLMRKSRGGRLLLLFSLSLLLALIYQKSIQIF